MTPRVWATLMWASSLMWWAGPAWAAPLPLDTVLQAVDVRVPQLAAAQAQLDEAEARILAARGTFDPVLNAKLGGYLGKDPRTVADVGLGVETLYGPTLELGYAYGVGDFPAYDGDAEAKAPGELYARLGVPVLDGLVMSSGRAKLLTTLAKRQAQAAKLDDQRVKVRRKAAESYWKWVAAGAKLAIEQSLLEIAESRQQALVRQEAEGTLAKIDLLDNQRALLLRRDTTAAAARDVAVAALALSLWYRDANGRPVVVPAEDLPTLAALPEDLPSLQDDLSLANNRPDVRTLQELGEAARVEYQRAGNALMPDLSFEGEFIQPLDPDGTYEAYGGAKLKLPTLSRKERGARAEADAAVQVVQEELRRTLDNARAEIEATRVAYEVAAQRVAWTEEAERLAIEVVRLERRRFELGGGSLFQLLAREDKLGSARKAVVNARFDQQAAAVARRAALGDTGLNN